MTTRIAHLGLGNFFRAHQAWYTAHASDAAEWGIAAFTGRSSTLPVRGGPYRLVVRGPDGDAAEMISVVSEVSAALEDWRRCFARAELAVLTTTITEAGYRRGPDGGLDHADPAVVADIAALRSHGVQADVTTAPGKLVLGLAVRRARGLPGLALVPCDNVPGNGSMLARVIGELATAVDPGLAAWIGRETSFVTTMVDRITPRSVDDTVVTEPYTEWVLAGSFPRGRPRWEDAGARFVEDIEPWEQRKLWLLNGSHSLMAYAGSIRGHDTVDQAIADPLVREWVEQWWQDAARHLPLPAPTIAAYRSALLERYANPRIRHRLAQIAEDGSQKVPIRVLPTIRADVAEGRVPEGAARILAAWICHLRGHGAPLRDADGARFVALAGGDLDPAVGRVLAELDAADPRLHDAVTALARTLDGSGRPPA